MRFVPLVDYPNHLARNFVLAHLHDPAFRFQDFYAPDSQQLLAQPVELELGIGPGCEPGRT